MSAWGFWTCIRRAQNNFGRITMSIQNLEARIYLLESGSGFVTLNDGTKFRPKDSGIRMHFNVTKLRRDLGREPMLADFPVDE